MINIDQKDVKKLVDQGVTVYAESRSYIVTKYKDDYKIKCLFNNSSIWLGNDGQFNMNNFYMEKENESN